MSFEIMFGKFESDSKTLNAYNHTSDFLHNFIVQAPFFWGEDFENIRTKDDTKENGERRL